MNFCSVPYEADYGMYADSKMKSVPQYPTMTMNPGQGQGQAMNVQPLNPPQMNLQMQMPSGMPQMSSYPMQGMPLNMMSGGGNAGMTPMSTVSQLPIGAMAPLNSMTMVPMMGNTMGSIDAPGINAVLPDLQPMSTMGQMQPMGQMGQMSQMQPLQQYGQSGSNTQLHQGRLTGGASPCPSSPSHAGSWNTSPGQMMASSGGSNGGGMWQYSQPMQQQQQQQPQYHQAPQYQHQQQHHNHAQQQQQAQQQGHRMKSTYDLAPSIHYRDVRNGLNSPSVHDAPKYSKGNNSFNCGKTVGKVPHWR